MLDFSAQNLMATVDDIMNYNKLETGLVQLQSVPFSLVAAVEGVCGNFKQPAMQKGIAFECNIDEQLKNLLVQGDELRLSQVLFHLVGNAIKFTNQGFVRIRVAQISSDQNHITVNFSISDSGIGMSKDTIDLLMNPFVQEMPRTQRQFQTSLGITIAGKLLVLQQSKLEVSSEEGVGSNFHFQLIYALAESQGSVQRPGSAIAMDELGHLSILCVDDEQLNLMVVKKILSKWNISADQAINGLQAVEMCRMKYYDIILMDINMPVMDGFEASTAIKELANHGQPAPVIIALTASVGSVKDEVLQFESIDDCILKPFKPEELRCKLHSWTEGHGPGI